MRHLGMMFVTRGATYPGLPSQFAKKAAFGDLLTAILAFVAITTATIYNAPPTMGPAYWIPALWVPMLLVTHYVTFILLLGSWK